MQVTDEMVNKVSAAIAHAEDQTCRFGLFDYGSEKHPEHVVRDHLEEKRTGKTVVLFRSKDEVEARDFYYRTIRHYVARAAISAMQV